MDSDTHAQAPVHSGLVRIIDKYVGYLRSDPQGTEGLGEIVSDIQDLYEVALRTQDVESVRYVRGFMQGVVTTLTATGQRIDQIKEWKSILALPEPTPASYAHKEQGERKERYTKKVTASTPISSTKDRIPFDRIKNQSSKNDQKTYKSSLKDAQFTDIPLEDLSEDSLPFDNPFYIRRTDLQQVSNVHYNNVTRRAKKIGIVSRKGNKGEGRDVWYLIKDRSVYDELKRDQRRSKLEEVALESESSSQESPQEGVIVIIKNAQFQETKIGSLDINNLPLSEGCYLRPTQIMELTGLSRSAIYSKLRSLGARQKKVGDNEYWYFINKSIHSKLVIDGRGRKQKTAYPEDKNTCPDNANPLKKGYVSVYGLSEELGMNRARLLENLTKLDIKTVDIEVDGIPVPHIDKTDEKKILARTGRAKD